MNKKIIGWIDLNGTFYQCGYSQHNECANALWGVNEESAEKYGFVKCYVDDLTQSNQYYVNRFLTQYQYNTLLILGFDVRTEDIPL